MQDELTPIEARVLQLRYGLEDGDCLSWKVRPSRRAAEVAPPPTRLALVFVASAPPGAVASPACPFSHHPEPEPLPPKTRDALSALASPSAGDRRALRAAGAAGAARACARAAQAAEAAHAEAAAAVLQ